MIARSLVVVGDAQGDVVSRIETSRSEITVVRSCQDLGEALGYVASGLADGVLAVAPQQDLTRSLVASFREHGAPVVLLGDPEGQARALSLFAVAPNASVDVISTALAQAAAEAEKSVPENASGDRGPSDSSGEQLPDPDAPAEGSGSAGSSATRMRSAGDGAGAAPGREALRPDSGTVSGVLGGEARPAERAQGRSWVVWGPLGAPGVTTLALNLAGELHLMGARVCLIDANTYASSCAAGFGLLDETSGISRACHEAERGELSPESLRGFCDKVRVHHGVLHVLTGITRADRWIEIRAAALREVIATARRAFDVVVIDVASCLERDEEAEFDPGMVQRNAAALTALADADRVLAVGLADPMGMPRLVRGLGDLSAAAPDQEPGVVFNRVRASVAGGDAQGEVDRAWQRFGTGAPVLAWLPEDARACDQAVFRGSLLAEDSPRSSLRGAVRGLAASLAAELPLELATEPVAEGRGRKRSLLVRRRATGRSSGGDKTG